MSCDLKLLPLPALEDICMALEHFPFKPSEHCPSPGGTVQEPVHGSTLLDALAPGGG